MKPLPWGDLQFFLAVAESGSIARAAQQMAVNHSTVLRRIAGLEDELGCRLFDRLPGGYALTAAGNHLAEHLSGLSEQFEAAQRQLLGHDAALRGPVRVSAADLVVEGLLMPLLAQFRRRHAAVQIQLLMGPRFGTLGKRDADVVLHCATQAPAGWVAQRVGFVERALYGAQRYLAGRDANAPHRRVLLDDDTAPAQDHAVARIDSIVGLADAVAEGLGVGLLPRPLAEVRPGLVQLAPPEPAARQPVWVLMHPEVQHTARVRMLFDLLVEALASDARLGH